MDRNVSIAVVIAFIMVGAMALWGLRKAGLAAPRPAPSAVTGKVTPAPTPRVAYPDKPAVLSETAPSVAAPVDESYWLWDGALLATRSLDDLNLYNQETDRPPVGYPNGTSRNQQGLTPKQRELLSARYIIAIPEASPIEVVSWGTNDLAQVRVLKGREAGSVGWINKHLLRYNRNGRFDAAFPVEIK